MANDTEVLQDTTLEDVSGGSRERRFPKGNNCYCPRCGRLISGRIALAVQGMDNELSYVCNDCDISWLSSTDARNYTMVSMTVNANGRYEILGPYQG